MKTSTAIVVLIVLVLLGGGAYYWYNTAYNNEAGEYGNTASSTNETSTTAPQGDGTTVGQNLILGLNTGSTLGSYLSAYNGMTLYTYSPDKPGVSNCTGTCAANWPPYTVASAADINIPASITGKVSTIVRTDGTLQVTYNDAPVYFYIKDTAPGQTNGQGVGGVWYVVKP